MKAQSKVYLQLQNIYKTKARKDAAEVLQTAQAIAGAGREVDPAEVDLFCKNAAFVKLINVEGGGDTARLGSKERLQQVLRKFISPLSVMDVPIWAAHCNRGLQS